jgi:hypothetical protein
MSTKVYCNVYARAFDVASLSFGQHGSGSSLTTMSGHIRHYPSKNVCQYMQPFYYHMRHILQIFHTASFLLFSQLKRALKRHVCAGIQAIQTAVTKQL